MKIEFKLLKEIDETIHKENGEVVKVPLGLAMNVVSDGRVIGTIEVRDGGYIYANITTGLPTNIVKTAILELTKNGGIDIPESEVEQSTEVE